MLYTFYLYIAGLKYLPVTLKKIPMQILTKSGINEQTEMNFMQKYYVKT
jgi:hypothetical protein